MRLIRLALATAAVAATAGLATPASANCPYVATGHPVPPPTHYVAVCVNDRFPVLIRPQSGPVPYEVCTNGPLGAGIWIDGTQYAVNRCVL